MYEVSLRLAETCRSFPTQPKGWRGGAGYEANSGTEEIGACDQGENNVLLTRSVFGAAVFALFSTANAGTVSFTGDLRSDANFLDCGFACTLGAGNTDAEYAQWAARSVSFVVAVASPMSAVTFGYGGGINGNGAFIAEGGFQPYLSLFTASGDFLGSTFFGVVCPPGANTDSVSGACYDVGLDGGILAPGMYQLAISAFSNMSYAENLGAGVLADGFTGLGNLAAGEDLHYAFDIILDSPASVPEPGTGVFLFAGAVAWLLSTRRLKRKKHKEKA
jgi:hypothetical protein